MNHLPEFAIPMTSFGIADPNSAYCPLSTTHITHCTLNHTSNWMQSLSLHPDANYSTIISSLVCWLLNQIWSDIHCQPTLCSLIWSWYSNSWRLLHAMQIYWKLVWKSPQAHEQSEMLCSIKNHPCIVEIFFVNSIEKFQKTRKLLKVEIYHVL